MNFESIVNQAAVRQILLRTVARDQLPNSYLFVGYEGVGKWAMALALAAYLNCPRRSDADSCGQCPSCRQIARLQHPNVYIAVPTPPSKSDKEELENYWEILEAKRAEPYALITGERQLSIPVATVREMKRSLMQKPAASGRRVVIIEQMERMLTSSADALLKMIEEPPLDTLIILTSSRPERLPATIISRCRRINFTRLPNEVIALHLTERRGLAADNATLLARLSQGSLGQALHIQGDEIAQDREIAKLLFKGITRAETTEVVAEAAHLLPFRDRSRIKGILLVWQALFRDVIALQGGADRSHLVNVDFGGELERLAVDAAIPRRLMNVPALIGTVIGDIDLNVDTQSAVGALIIRIREALQGQPPAQ